MKYTGWDSEDLISRDYILLRKLQRTETEGKYSILEIFRKFREFLILLESGGKSHNISQRIGRRRHTLVAPNGGSQVLKQSARHILN